MKIAVDLDDTLSVVDRVTRASGYIARMGLPYKLVDPDAHALADVFDWDLPAVLEFVHAGGVVIFTDAAARKGAKETLTELRSEGHEILVLTARSKEWFINPEKVSRDWLEKRHIPYDGIVAEVRKKGEYCLLNGVDVLVDDNPAICLAAQELGVRAVLLGDRRTRLPEGAEMRYRGANWAQVAAILRRISMEISEEGNE